MCSAKINDIYVSDNVIERSYMLLKSFTGLRALKIRKKSSIYLTHMYCNRTYTLNIIFLSICICYQKKINFSVFVRDNVIDCLYCLKRSYEW